MPTYPLSFPPFTPKTEQLVCQRRQAAQSSPFTYQQGPVVNTAAQWMLQFTWPQMSVAEAQYLSAWLSSLQGIQGSFTYQPYVALGSSLTGQTLNVSGYGYNNQVQIAGFVANGNPHLYVGQYFQLGTQLLQITSAPAAADASGHCIVEFQPPLRADVAAGTVVNFSSPVGLFRLASSDGNPFTATPGGGRTLAVCEFGTINAVEAI